jgi:hypothetical protein
MSMIRDMCIIGRVGKVTNGLRQLDKRGYTTEVTLLSFLGLSSVIISVGFLGGFCYLYYYLP